jgi:hypothetical protein
VRTLLAPANPPVISHTAINFPLNASPIGPMGTLIPWPRDLSICSRSSQISPAI